MKEQHSITERVALVDADSLIYSIGYQTDKLEEDRVFAVKLLRQSVDNILDGAECSMLELYLGTDTNYRDSIATMKPYKGNRETSNRPQFYRELRAYLVKQRGAVLCVGQEAEDVVGIRSYEFDNFDDFVICHIDKDLDMLAGVHYNYRTGKSYEVDRYQALRNFYVQLVTGDSVDNIPGLYHQLLIDEDGEAAYKFRYSRYKSKLIKDLSELTDELSMWQHVYGIYKEWGQISKHGIDRILEIGQLLWLRREQGELWVHPIDRKFDYITDDIRENKDE